MSVLEFVIQVLTLVAGVGLGLFIRSYLPSYFEKKGENRAVKEDSADITGIDETVRSAIAEISTKRGAHAEERKALLLKYFDLLVDLYYDRLAVNFGDFPVDHGESLFAFEQGFYENASDLLKTFQRIAIYFDYQSDMYRSAETVINAVLAMRLVMKKHFPKLKAAFIKEDAVFLSGDLSNLDPIDKPTRATNAAYWEAMKPAGDELKAAFRDFLKSLNEYLRPGELPKIPSEMFSAGQ